MEAQQRGSSQVDNQCRVTLQLSDCDRNLLSHDAGGPDYRHLAAACCKHDPRSVCPNPERHFFELVWCFFWSNWDLKRDENPSSVRDNSIHSVQMILHPGTLNSVATTHGVASGPSRMNRMVRLGLKVTAGTSRRSFRQQCGVFVK